MRSKIKNWCTPDFIEPNRSWCCQPTFSRADNTRQSFLKAYEGAIMTNLDIAHRRLHNQLITHRTFEKPGDVVSWLGAVQAQDYLGALWAVGMRMRNAVEADIEQAIADGAIVRTHPMRVTWHFVAAADIRWLLTLMAPGRIASNALWYRRLELDEATLAKSKAVFAKTLQGG